MFSFEGEELGDEFEHPMDTKGGRTMVALPILVSLRPKEKRMTMQICLLGWTKQRMGLSTTWCWTAKTLWNGFFHQETCQSFMTIIRSYSRCWDWMQLRFLTLQCCGFEFECEFQHYLSLIGHFLILQCCGLNWFWIWVWVWMLEFVWPLWCKVQHFSPGLSAGLEGLPWVPAEDHVPWLFNSFSGKMCVNVQTWPCLAPKVHCVWHLRTVQIATSWSSSATTREIGLCKGIPCSSEVTIYWQKLAVATLWPCLLQRRGDHGHMDRRDGAGEVCYPEKQRFENSISYDTWLGYVSILLLKNNFGSFLSLLNWPFGCQKGLTIWVSKRGTILGVKNTWMSSVWLQPPGQSFKNHEWSCMELGTLGSLWTCTASMRPTNTTPHAS